MPQFDLDNEVMTLKKKNAVLQHQVDRIADNLVRLKAVVDVLLPAALTESPPPKAEKSVAKAEKAGR